MTVQTELNRNNRNSTILAVGVAIVAMSISLLLSGRAARSVTRPIRDLCDLTEKVAGGDFSVKTQVEAGDEIAVLTRSFNDMTEEIGILVDDIRKKQENLRIIENRLLQEQINPHFLYNALSSISVLAMGNGDKVASRAILYLSDFYRITLSKGKQDITIREELNLLESYLKIQRMRFDDSIEVEYELDESLLDVHVVKLTLQPIVENAIHHGRDDDSEVFHILIRLFEEQGKTVFEVIDDGCGMDPEKLMQLQNSMNHSEGGYCRRNVNIRIKLQYGSQYGVYIESERGFGTKIRIEFPWRERAKAREN